MRKKVRRYHEKYLFSQTEMLSAKFFLGKIFFVVAVAIVKIVTFTSVLVRRNTKHILKDLFFVRLFSPPFRFRIQTLPEKVGEKTVKRKK